MILAVMKVHMLAFIIGILMLDVKENGDANG